MGKWGYNILRPYLQGLINWLTIGFLNKAGVEKPLFRGEQVRY